MEKDFQFLNASKDAGDSPGNQAQPPGRREILLAILPFLLILLADVLPMLLVLAGLLNREAPFMRVLNTGLVTLLFGTIFAVLFVAWRKKWPSWSATWYFFFAIVPLLLAIALFELFFGSGRFKPEIQPEVLYLALPAVIAVFLYAEMRLDRRRGLLAALPVLYLIWLPNMEFVPDSIEAPIKIASTILISLLIAFLLRQTNWRAGLFAVLGVYWVVGNLYSYAGIYHGGTLPFVAPGPNLGEVARSFVPQYLAVCAILLGPLFAWKFRQIGRLAGRAGVAAYHLALAGLLLVILVYLAALMSAMDNRTYFPRGVLNTSMILGLFTYLGGVVWLYSRAGFGKSTPNWGERVLLALLPVAMPMTFALPFISYRTPVSHRFGIPLLWKVPHWVSLSLGLAWLALSIWLVTRDWKTASPAPSRSEAPDTPHLSEAKSGVSATDRSIVSGA